MFWKWLVWQQVAIDISSNIYGDEHISNIERWAEEHIAFLKRLWTADIEWKIDNKDIFYNKG